MGHTALVTVGEGWRVGSVKTRDEPRVSESGIKFINQPFGYPVVNKHGRVHPRNINQSNPTRGLMRLSSSLLFLPSLHRLHSSITYTPIVSRLASHHSLSLRVAGSLGSARSIMSDSESSQGFQIDSGSESDGYLDSPKVSQPKKVSIPKKAPAGGSKAASKPTKV